MNFLSPAFLIGLPLLAVPIVIHLLSRRQQKKISWGAMRFLVQAATRKRRLWRLTDILLLALRTAAFLFFIFALARPLLPATWLGGSVPREVILVLDQSMSLSRQVNGSSLFERQLQKAGELLGDLKPSDTVRVLLAGESPEWLTPESLPANASTVRKLRTQIHELKPTLGAADLIACVREAADLEEATDRSARVIVVISDGQRFGWRIDEKPAWAAVQNRIQQSAVPTAVSLEFLDAPKPQGNLSVNDVKSLRAFGAVDQPLNFTAAIHNHSATASATTLLSWRVNGEGIGVTTVPELAPASTTTLSLAHPFGSPSAFDVTCHLETTDDLAADNEGHLLVDIYERLPVLVVEDPPDDGPSDATFILAALGASANSTADKRWRSVFEPTVIGSTALAVTDLKRFHAIIVASTRSLPPAATEKLEAHARNGGGIWIALGDRIDIDSFNSHFYRGGLGLSPARLSGAVGDPNHRESFFTLRATSDAHPATMLLSDFQRLDLDRARIYRRHQFDLASGKDVSILLQAQGGEPVVIERKLGRGRVLVQGVPLGVSWSTLPLCQAYVAMLHEWLWYLCEPGLPRHNLSAGEMLVHNASDANSTAELAAPDGRRHELAASTISGTPQFRFNGTRLAGEYLLQTNRADSSASPAKFYVHRNPLESDLRSFSEQERQQLAAMKGVHFSAGLGPLTAKGNVQVPRHPLEGMLLVILAIVLIAEITLAGWTTHRRTLRVQPVTMEG
jgi:hypothetical protein